MNKFDDKYEIRFATVNDIDTIMNFIDNYWSKNHIMSVDKELFRYEYADGEHVNFILAIDRNTRFLEAIFGFIPCSHTKDKAKKDIWGSMWKVNSEHDNIPLLGIELAKRIFTLTQCRTHIGNGANPNTTIPLRKLYFGDKTVKMKQYYYLNTDIDNYKIAIIKEKIAPSFSDCPENFLISFSCINELKKEFNIENLDTIPYKDNWYINKRYFLHPYYHYNVYGVIDSKLQKVNALLVTRIIECNQSKVLRIVDYIGNQELFSGLGSEFKRMIKENHYEYIDFYNYGFKEDIILKCGFTLRTEDDKNIIPNYFEPFLRENIDIWAHYKLEGTLFFKADGDQDRPNIPRMTSSS